MLSDQQFVARILACARQHGGMVAGLNHLVNVEMEMGRQIAAAMNTGADAYLGWQLWHEPGLAYFFRVRFPLGRALFSAGQGAPVLPAPATSERRILCLNAPRGHAIAQEWIAAIRAVQPDVPLTVIYGDGEVVDDPA